MTWDLYLRAVKALHLLTFIRRHDPQLFEQIKRWAQKMEKEEAAA